MDWTMVGALAEMLGALGVIATLVYLARQIRQSNMADRQLAVRETLDLTDRFLQELSASPQVAGLFVRGLADDADLTSEEMAQLYALFLRTSYLWQRSWEFEGDIGTDISAAARLEIAGSPGFQRWFQHRGHWLDNAFRAQLEREIKASPGYTAPRDPATQAT